MVAERTLTRRELNRALLARQLLLERAPLPIPEALERMGGLQAQYAPSMYVGLWSRLEGFERDELTRALEERAVVQATLMRSTIHLVSRSDFWPFAQATRAARQAQWLRSMANPPSVRAMAGSAQKLRRALEASSPLRRTDLDALLGTERARGVGLWLDLVRVPPSGTWERRRADLYAAAEDWIGPPEVTAEQGLELLVRRYLAAFGPASRKDVASFTGVAARPLAPVLQRLQPRRFRSEDGTELLDLPDAPLPDPETPAPVRLLPTWDASLLVHARRTQVLPEEHRPRVFSTRNPQSVSTFLVDGAVAGAWRWDAGRVDLEPYSRLDRETLRSVREEADRVRELYA